MSTPRKMPQFMLRLKLNPNTSTTVAEGGAEILWCFCSCMVVFIQIIVRSIIHYYWYCVVPENIQTPTTEGIGNSEGVGG